MVEVLPCWAEVDVVVVDDLAVVVVVEPACAVEVVVVPAAAVEVVVVVPAAAVDVVVVVAPDVVVVVVVATVHVGKLTRVETSSAVSATQEALLANVVVVQPVEQSSESVSHSVETVTLPSAVHAEIIMLL